jgi:hypothetical protein
MYACFSVLRIASLKRQNVASVAPRSVPEVRPPPGRPRVQEPVVDDEGEIFSYLIVHLAGISQRQVVADSFVRLRLCA